MKNDKDISLMIEQVMIGCGVIGSLPIVYLLLSHPPQSYVELLRGGQFASVIIAILIVFGFFSVLLYCINCIFIRKNGVKRLTAVIVFLTLTSFVGSSL